jgi:DHA3 family macrolide efflux protein-like MFS transporter
MSTGTVEAKGGPSPWRSGMRGFTIVWAGQLVSLLGTAMTTFALVIWAWQETGSATALALVAFFGFLPNALMMPFAGALVDRHSRKLMMVVSDSVAGCTTIVMLLLYTMGRLELWHVYGLLFVSSAFQSFQFPAYSAAITMMVKKGNYARASGMLSTAQSASTVFAPIAAGILLAFIGIGGIMTIDVATFLFAITMVLIVRIPQPPESEEGRRARKSLLKDATFGFGYIRDRRPLLSLLSVFFAFNLMIVFGFVVLQPMVLAKTGDDERILGLVMTLGGVGGVIGGVAMSVWGGPRRRVNGILLGMLVVAAGLFILGLGREVVVWSVGMFAASITIPIANACSQAIWQAKVPPDLQGRVFATRALIATVGIPVSQLIAGPLADWVFEPAMDHATGPLAALVGSGPGAGMSLMLVIAAVLGMLVCAFGYSSRNVREVEDLIPDHEVDADDDERTGEDGDARASDDETRDRNEN